MFKKLVQATKIVCVPYGMGVCAVRKIVNSTAYIRQCISVFCFGGGDENFLLRFIFTGDVSRRVTMHIMIVWGAENPHAM